MLPLRDWLTFSRRTFLAGSAASTLQLPKPGRALHPFELWEAERHNLEAALDRAAEGERDDERERLFSQISDVEHLILETPCLDPPAIRAKARLLTWYMEMEQADGLPAMRHILGFLERLT